MGISKSEIHPAVYNQRMQTMTVRPSDPLTSPPDHDAPQVFRITPRVLALLFAVARFGLLSADQIARLDGGSRQKVTRILQRCVEHQLLKRPGQQPIALTSFFDTRPRPYALTPKGFRCLAEAGVPTNARPNKSTTQLQHSIETAEAMFAFDAAVAAHGALQLIDHHDLLPLMPPKTRALPKPFCLRTTVRPIDFPHLDRLIKKPTAIGVEPDRLFSLVQPDNTGWSFGLELDRGTEDVTARQLKGKVTYFRKQLAYFACWRGNVHIEQWGEAFKAFRVLTITPSEARFRNMIEAQQEITRSELFLYSTLERIKAQGALGPVWTSSTREDISLLRRD